MPNGWDLEGYFKEGKRGARAGAILSLVGLVLTVLAWTLYGVVGLAWVSILQGIVLALSVLSIGSQKSAIWIALRGTKDESEFMETTRIGVGTHKEIRDLWSKALAVKQQISQIRGESERQTR